MDAATAEARLKNMTAWQCAPELSQEDIDMLLLLAQRADNAGREITDADWVPSWHLEWAAAEAWGWKAACLAGNYNMTAQGTTLSRSQAFDHAEKMYALYRRKSSNFVYAIRSTGNLVVDRMSGQPTPWWMEQMV